jgi:predicted secreted protein
MQRSVATVAIGLFLGALIAVAARADDHTLNYNLVRLDADASASVPNDQMRVQMLVQHEARDASALPALVNSDMRWALDLAKQHPKVRVQTGDYNTQPEYASNRIVGWRAFQHLQLEGEDFGQVSALVTELQQKLQVQGMSFQPTRETRLKVEQELSKVALKAFQAKSKLIAETMGAGGYEVVDISIGGAGQPFQPYMRAAPMAMEAASAPVAVEGGTATLTVTVSGQIQLR